MAAARESFAKLGFASTRVADIVARAGTSHGTFYTYFDDKRIYLGAYDNLNKDKEKVQPPKKKVAVLLIKNMPIRLMYKRLVRMSCWPK